CQARSEMCIRDRTTKASGLKALAQQLGIDRSEIMALGDAANDLEMLKFAGHSVAMGNAAASVKAVCNYQTASNDQAGVAQAIYEYVLK
ncbi:HAD hydrolase family protein, partial [Streptococcus sobrinus]|uniref:HAD hydrolase family protein n=1 Tax=Streptococcus sobrinus TaxID=1310 RepID=UPI000497BB6C